MVIVHSVAISPVKEHVKTIVREDVLVPQPQVAAQVVVQPVAVLVLVPQPQAVVLDVAQLAQELAIANVLMVVLEVVNQVV